MKLQQKLSVIASLLIFAIAGLALSAQARLVTIRGNTFSLQTGSWTQTTQEDFQSGERWGVDTYHLPGSLTLLSLHDNFDGNTLNLDRWSLYMDGGVVITQVNGTLQIANPTWGHRAVGFLMLTGDYLQGDFATSVDFEMVDWHPTVCNTQAHFLVRDSLLRYVEIKREAKSHWSGYPDCYASAYGGSGWYTFLNKTQRSDTNGRFLISRAGETFTTHYRNLDQWIPHGAVNYFDTSTGASLAVWNNDSMPTFDIRYDNFRVTRNGGIEDPTYVFTGTYTSPAFDTGDSSYFSTIVWTPHVQLGEIGDESLKFQIATNSDNATWIFLGPDGTAKTYYTQSGQQIWGGHNGDRYIKYRATLSTQNSNFTPQLDDTMIRFAPASDFRLVRLPFDGEFRDHYGNISSYFDHLGPWDGGNYPDDGEISIFTGQNATRQMGARCNEDGSFGTSQWVCYRTFKSQAPPPSGQTSGENWVAYDGHNGYDYALAPGTAIYPTAPGTVTQMMGEIIKIEHEASYETWYAHLQNDPDVYQEWLNAPGRRLPIEPQRIIGAVQASYGHVHFALRHNDQFIDPYGWFGHTGSFLESSNDESSRWLWVQGEPSEITYDPSGEANLTSSTGDAKIGFPIAAYQDTLTLQLLNSQATSLSQFGSAGHSFILQAWGTLGNPVVNLLKPISITVRYEEGDASAVFEDTLALYRWDSASGSWQKMPSQLDIFANVVNAEVDRLGHFALMGQIRYYKVYLPLVER